jgi:phage repressor protein C with HTH and peptisase S24 domain
MIANKDRLRIRMLSYASRLLSEGLNDRSTAGIDKIQQALGFKEVEIARELLEILNETGDAKHSRKSL